MAMTGVTQDTLQGRGSRAPGAFLLGLTVLVTLIGCYYASVYYPYVEGIAFSSIAWCVLLITWLVRLVIALRKGRVGGVRWVLVPLCLLVYVAAFQADAVRWARFKVSESSLEQYARDVARTGAKSGCEWVGLYRLCGDYQPVRGLVSGGAGPISGGVELLVTDWPLMPSRGFVWFPGRGTLPDDVYCEEYDHLTGPWWTCRAWDGF